MRLGAATPGSPCVGHGSEIHTSIFERDPKKMGSSSLKFSIKLKTTVNKALSPFWQRYHYNKEIEILVNAINLIWTLSYTSLALMKNPKSQPEANQHCHHKRSLPS